jgi:hypothetical protein
VRQHQDPPNAATRRFRRFHTAELADHINGKQPDDLAFAGIPNGQSLRVSTFRTAFRAAARTVGYPTCTRFEP